MPKSVCWLLKRWHISISIISISIINGSYRSETCDRAHMGVQSLLQGNMIVPMFNYNNEIKVKFAETTKPIQ